MMKIQMNKQVRVEVDPNGRSRRNADLTVVDLTQGLAGVRVGTDVIVFQSDVNGEEFVGRAVLESVDEIHQLAYLKVDWRSFRTQPSNTDLAFLPPASSKPWDYSLAFTMPRDITGGDLARFSRSLAYGRRPSTASHARFDRSRELADAV